MSEIQTEEECTKQGGTWADGKCSMPPADTPAAEEAAKASALTETALVDRITAVFKDALNAEMTQLKAQLKAEREKIVKQNEDELEKALRQSLGVDKDLPVTRSQIAEVVRKAMLEEAETQKKTPAPKTKALETPVKDPFDQAVEARYKAIGAA